MSGSNQSNLPQTQLAEKGVASGGVSVPHRDKMEGHFGTSFADVSAHTGPAAAKANRALGAEAYAFGTRIAFVSPNPPEALVAHELAHVVQQRAGAGPEGGVGQPGDDFEIEAEQAASAVTRGDAPDLAARYPCVSGGAAVQCRSLQKYDSYEHANIGDAAGGSRKQRIQGVELSSGEINALADFYATPADLKSANKAELTELVRLIRKQQDDPTSVIESDWDKATGHRYTELNLKNSKHFGPKNKDLLNPSPTVSEVNDNRTTFVTYHTQALTIAQAAAAKPSAKAKSDLEQAQIINSFGEHYLVDAFSAGHLFNKDDATAKIDSNIGSLTAEQKEALFATVAVRGWASNSTLIRKYQAYKLTYIPFLDDWWDLNSPERWKSVLEAVSQKRPDVMSSAIVKAAHDSLNQRKERGQIGVPVENDLGGKWVLSGDRTLVGSPETQKWIKQALEMSRANLKVASTAASVDIGGLVKRVLALLPRPSAASTTLIHNLLSMVTDPKDGMIDAIVQVIEGNLHSLLDGMVADGSVRKNPGTAAPPTGGGTAAGGGPTSGSTSDSDTLNSGEVCHAPMLSSAPTGEARTAQ